MSRYESIFSFIIFIDFNFYIAILILGHAISHLFYKGYVYNSYLYALVLQLIEDVHNIDPAVLTIEEKKTIVKQLQLIYSYGNLHNDIAPKSHNFFFVDLGLSKIVSTESLMLCKKKKKLKKTLTI